MSYVLLVLVSLLTCTGQLLQKQAVDSWKAQADGDLKAMLVSPWLWGAIVALGCAMLLWLLVLQHLPVSVAYPMLSLNFVFVTLAARYFFSEPTDLRHWLGIGLIMAGIVLLKGV